MKQIIKFVLVPDSSAARRLRRLLASRSPCQGVVVGTWPELIEQSRSAYLIRPSISDWETRFNDALAHLPDAFWTESYQVAPDETTAEVAAAFSLIMGATDPAGKIGITNSEQLSARPRRNINDLIRLSDELDGALPDDLLIIQQLISADSNNAIRLVSVCCAEGFPTLPRWQLALVDKLNADSGALENAELMNLLNSLALNAPLAAVQNSLHALQVNLFESPDKRVPLDTTVQWVGVRDYLQEAEIGAGMAQQILSENPELTPSDIGLLVPDSFEYSLAVKDTFTTAGLSLSGLPVDNWHQDLGCEALFHFLYCRQKPSPSMALAVCLSSPLMPWSNEQGAKLAQNVMDGDYKLLPFKAASKSARQMLDLLREGDETPQTPDNCDSLVHKYIRSRRAFGTPRL